ncbi:MAG: hypothetical protein V4858_07015 [Pseudomonadota bacterium]
MNLQSTQTTLSRMTRMRALALVLLGASSAAFAAAPPANPGTHMVTPNGQTALKQGVMLQPATLTSIKQVPYTDQGTETWIQVQGTGNCSYTITGGGVAPQSFASSAAKPFPMKIKIMGAPLGSHLWTAKGTGNCMGNATTTFSVNG